MTGGTTVDRGPGWHIKTARSVVDSWNRVGAQIKFNVRSVRETGIALTRYHTEILRLIAQMSLGTGHWHSSAVPSPSSGS